jgi:hypothetical protein
VATLGARLVAILDGRDPQLRDTPFAATCAGASRDELLDAGQRLHAYQADCDNLYRGVRCLLFLATLHRFHLVGTLSDRGRVPEAAAAHLEGEDGAAAVAELLRSQERRGPSAALASALSRAYRLEAFRRLREQVRASVRATTGNRWLFECREPSQSPFSILETLRAQPGSALRERTPVRLDLSHSGWSDIFFLGMDDPDAARVLNLSIDLAVQGPPAPPVEVRLGLIERPVLRLASDDLHAEVELVEVAEVFDFAADGLGLLRAGVVASGLVPPGLETAGGSLAALLERLAGPGRGISLTTRVNGIPKGSRLAVSTSLLASVVAVCMRATGQTRSPSGPLLEDERRTVAGRAVLGEWLGGSGGGWQDSGGLWPGAKRIEGVAAEPGDPEYGVSRGRLLPTHTPLPFDAGLREELHASLLLAHGGMAQDVGPILERVTEGYLLRDEPAWSARRDARRIYDQMLSAWAAGDVRALARATDRNFHGPLTTILPQSTNLYTETVIERLRARLGDDYRGFWMLGGMSGGGMGFWVEPARHDRAREVLHEVLAHTARELAHAMPFAIAPVLYDFAVNDVGSTAEPVAPGAPAEALLAPAAPARASQSLEALLARPGFDHELHERVRSDLRAGRIGLSCNRLPGSSRIEDVGPEDTLASEAVAPRYERRGLTALAEGRAAVVTLAGGVGSRWTRGAGVVKALHPVCAVEGRHRRFLDYPLAKTRRLAHRVGALLPHVVTTSYATHGPIEAYLTAVLADGDPVETRLSPGQRFGLRLIPTVRDLDASFAARPHPRGDERAAKLRLGAEAATRAWARESGEASDYRDRDAEQCLHPVGHWYEIPNLLSSGVLARLLLERPGLEVLLVHNVDTLGVALDPGLLGWFLSSPHDLAFEVVPRLFGDTGGGLARVDGRLRLVEALALPVSRVAATLCFYSSMTTWLRIDGWLRHLGLTRGDLPDAPRVEEAVRAAAERVPTYVTLKDVRRRWGQGQEDVLPVAQFEKLWGDVSALPDLDCAYLAVPRLRGQQLKDPAELDGWLRDGSADYAASLCDWE